MPDQDDSRPETTPQRGDNEAPRVSFKIDVSGASREDIDRQIAQFRDDVDQQIAHTGNDPIRTRLLEAARAALNNSPQQGSEVAGYLLGGVFEHTDLHWDVIHNDTGHTDVIRPH
jgi:hypothetical protein